MSKKRINEKSKSLEERTCDMLLELAELDATPLKSGNVYISAEYANKAAELYSRRDEIVGELAQRSDASFLQETGLRRSSLSLIHGQKDLHDHSGCYTTTAIFEVWTTDEEIRGCFWDADGSGPCQCCVCRQGGGRWALSAVNIERKMLPIGFEGKVACQHFYIND